MALEYLFAFVMMLSVLIFVHELGHFLVAKACGVRVLKFSLGFGNPIGIGRYRLRWKRGHTEYVVAWIPLGGFVKMLGEYTEDASDEEAVAHPSETLPGRPLWQKLSIVFAGPAMNLLLPVLVFMVILAIGLDRRGTLVGTVEAGSPAAVAGIEAGDQIVQVDDQPVDFWEDLEGAIVPNPGGTATLVYRRDGAEQRTQLEVGARQGLDEFGTTRDLGWIGLEDSLPRAQIAIAGSDAPARAAGLRSGDRVISVAGEPADDWYRFEAAYAAAGTTGRVEFGIERGSGDPPEKLTLRVPALGSAAALGVGYASVVITGVTPDSAASRAGLEAGDVVLTVGGAPVASFGAFAEVVRDSEGRTLELDVARDGVQRRVDVTPELTTYELGMGLEETRYMVGITAERALPGSIAIDRVRNPLVSLPRAVGMTVDLTHAFLRGLGKLVTGEVSRKQLAGPIGIAQLAGDAYRRGWESYLKVMVLISINLGILNLLPIPILDGGQALVFLVEGVRRGPLSLRTREVVQQLGLTVLILLMGLAFWNDISRNWSSVVDWLRRGAGL